MIQFYWLNPKGGMPRIQNLSAPSINSLFTDLDQYLEKLEALGVNTNVFYTVQECTTEDRVFARHTHLYLDIDHCDVTKWEEYRKVIQEVLVCESINLSVVMSGHGLHFIMPLTPNRYWEGVEQFPLRKGSYRKLCADIDAKLLDRKLPGNTDTSVFDRARVFRLPGTWNSKPKQTPVKAQLLALGLTPLDYELPPVGSR
jgi:hypothetical protein